MRISKRNDLYDIRIIKGCCKGKVCRAKKIVEDGTIFYICSPSGNKLFFTEDYIEVLNKVK